MKKIVSLVLALICSGVLYGQVTLLTSGNWSNASNWDSGYVPTAGSNVIIPSGKTDSIDISNAECQNLTISGNLYFARTNGNGITVHGNTVINNAARFRMSSATPTAGQFFQYIDFKGDVTVNSGGTLDMRQSSGAIGSVGRIRFSGSTNSTLSLALSVYTSASEEFNSLEIAKTGGAKVVLSTGNIYFSNNSSNMPDTLVLTSGVLETGNNYVVLLRTGSLGITGGSSSSYVYGNLGRGVSNGGGAVEITYPVGDATTYRPVTIQFNAPVNATGHYAWTKVITGNANTGSSTLNGGLQKVSANRYYQIGYSKNAGTGTTMPVGRVSMTYRADDGVVAGNQHLRVAYSTDTRATWDTLGGTEVHTTDLTSPPTSIVPDILASPVNLSDGGSFFTALGSLNSTSNPLPVELVSFTGSVRGTNVELQWSTATEMNNSGFSVEKNVNGSWNTLGFVEGAGTSNSPKHYSFTDANVASGSCSYRLKQIDRDGKFEYSQNVEVSVAGAPTTLALNGNYPNPFNPVTNISFTVPAAGLTSLKVFDVLGKEVASVFNGIAEPGTAYSVPFNAASLPSGIYFSRLEFGGQRIVKKMLLVK
jgi:hypothetical protein